MQEVAPVLSFISDSGDGRGQLWHTTVQFNVFTAVATLATVMSLQAAVLWWALRPRAGTVARTTEDPPAQTDEEVTGHRQPVWVAKSSADVYHTDKMCRYIKSPERQKTLRVMRLCDQCPAARGPE